MNDTNGTREQGLSPLPAARGEAVAIIQASMVEPSPAGPITSSHGAGPRRGTRLSGRLLRQLGGRPVLRHLIERVQQAAGTVVVALSVAREDDQLQPVARSAGALVFRGSVHDMVGRLAGCVDELGLDEGRPVVRVLSDCTLIDGPYLQAGVLALRATRGAAVEFQEDQAESLCPGLSAGFLTVGAIKHVDRRARAPVHRADVMAYLYEHPGEVSLHRVPLPDSLAPLCGSFRLLLQTAEDLALQEAIYLRLYHGSPIDTAKIMMFLHSDPVLASLNRGVLQRGLTLPLKGHLGWRAR